jgi:hypothetical protein
MGQAMRKQEGELESRDAVVRTGIDVLLARNFDLLRGATVAILLTFQLLLSLFF